MCRHFASHFYRFLIGHVSHDKLKATCFYETYFYSILRKCVVSNALRMPSADELAELSHNELNECIRVAFYQWQKTIQKGEDAAECKQIFHAYDNERLKRLERLKKYITK
jgi:hypothetical protein